MFIPNRLLWAAVGDLSVTPKNGRRTLERHRVADDIRSSGSYEASTLAQTSPDALMTRRRRNPVFMVRMVLASMPGTGPGAPQLRRLRVTLDFEGYLPLSIDSLLSYCF
jgi:hypothetical protein